MRALDDDEAVRIDNHLLFCQPCETEQTAWSSVAPLLAVVPRTQEPSPALKTRILSQASARPTARARTARTALSLPSQPRTRLTTSVPRSRTARQWTRFATVPIIGVIMVLTLLTVSSQQQLSQERNRSDRLEGENAAITDSLFRLQAGGGEAGSARWYPLLSVDASFADAGGLVMGDPSQSTAFLSVWNMPEKIGPYHVICESKFGELLSAGQLQVNDLGVGAVTLNLPGPITEYRVVHIVHADDMVAGSDPRPNDVLLVRLEDSTAVPPID